MHATGSSIQLTSFARVSITVECESGATGACEWALCIGAHLLTVVSPSCTLIGICVVEMFAKYETLPHAFTVWDCSVQSGVMSPYQCSSFHCHSGCTQSDSYMCMIHLCWYRCADNHPCLLHIHWHLESSIRVYVHCKNTWVTLTTFLGCPSCISVTKECYQIGFLNWKFTEELFIS